MTDASPTTFKLRPGEIIGGRYEVLEHIGSGAMGDVYKARQIDLGSIVALKMLRPHATISGDAIKRMQQEAKALATLNHPCLPKVHRVDHHGEVLFLAMDFVEGTSLQHYIQTHGAMPVEQAVELFSQLAGALSHAHENGIVHRDIKPGNIMLVGEGAQLKPVLLDFGIAKIMDRGQKLTQTGGIIGTVSYMSPEQACGGAIDARSDIYSLACVLYETVSGKPPYEAESSVELMMKHISETIPPLGEACFGDIAPVLGKAFAKRPDERFQTMTEFAAALQAPSSVVASIRKRSSFKPNLRLLIACAAAFVGAACAAAFFYHGQNDKETNDPTWTIMRVTQTLEMGVGNEVPPDLVERAIAQIDNMHMDSVNRSKSYDCVAKMRCRQKRYDEAEKYWRMIYPLSRKTGMSPAFYAERLVTMYAIKGEDEKTIPHLLEVVKDDDAAGVGLTPTGLVSKQLLATYYMTEKKYDQAMKLYQLLAQQSPDKVPDEVAEGSIGIAEVLWITRRKAQARAQARAFLDKHRSNSDMAAYIPRATNVLAASTEDLAEEKELFKQAFEEGKRVNLSNTDSYHLQRQQALVGSQKSRSAQGVSLCEVALVLRNDSRGSLQEAHKWAQRAVSEAEHAFNTRLAQESQQWKQKVETMIKDSKGPKKT